MPSSEEARAGAHRRGGTPARYAQKITLAQEAARPFTINPELYHFADAQRV
jgi:hypothetical protein